MADQLGREKPLRKGGTRSRASKAARSRRVMNADERAQNRFAIVQAGLAKLRQPNISLRESYRLLKDECNSGTCDLTDLPPRSTYCRWMKSALEKHAKDEPVTIQQFRDAPRSGRPVSANLWHPLVVEEFNEALLSGLYPSIPLLHEHLEKWARLNQLTAPSEDAVRRRANDTNIEELSAAYHGRRSARADQSAKLTVPVDYPHEIWTLDELDARNWVKAMHPIQRTLVPVRPKVIAIIENFSRPALNFHVCQPFKNGETTVSFDSEDVLGAYFGALFRELAREPYKQYTGFIPSVIRMDAAKQHNALKLFHRKVWGEKLAAPELERYAAWPRGNIEALVGRFDDLCSNIRFHVRNTIPRPLTKELQEKVRSVAASTSSRARRRAIVDVDDLLTINEYQAELDRVAGEYQERVHSMLGTSPHVSYHNHLRKNILRPASDVLNLIEPVTLTVTDGGIEHRKRRFTAVIGGEPVETGRQLICRPDPLRRGIWAEVDGLTYFFMPVEDFARAQHPGIWVRDQKQRTKDASEAGADALNAQLDRQMAAPRGFQQMEDIARPGEQPSAQKADGSAVTNAAEKPKEPAKRQRGTSKKTDPVPPASTQTIEPAAELPAAVPDTAPTRRLPRGVVPPRNANLKIIR